MEYLLPAILIDKDTFNAQINQFVQNSTHQYTAFVVTNTTNNNNDDSDIDDDLNIADYRNLYDVMRPTDAQQFENYAYFRPILSKYLVLNKESRKDPQKLALDTQKTVYCARTTNVYEPSGIIWDGELCELSTFDEALGRRLPYIVGTINGLCIEIADMYRCRKSVEQIRDQRDEMYENVIDESDIFIAR